MELDPRSPEFICTQCVQLYSFAETQQATPLPPPPPTPAFGLIYDGAIGQPR